MNPLDWQLTIDSRDPHALSDFWAEVLGYELEDHHDQITELLAAGQVDETLTVRHHDRLSWVIGAALRGADRRILFTRVPEPKTVKNRWHIDLQRRPAAGGRGGGADRRARRHPAPRGGGVGSVPRGHAGSGGQRVLRSVT